MRKITGKIKSLAYLSLHHWRYKLCFGAISRKSRLLLPLKIDGAKRIFIGQKVVVEKYSWLSATQIQDTVLPTLVIGDGTKIGHFNHIYCTSSITIEENVLTADKVYISDNLHSYEDTTIPICDQPVKQLPPVIIGTGAWLGENVCVIGASIGKGSVVGANSVVTKDIPDYCIAVGSPAKVIKRYNHTTKQWEKIY